MENKTLFRRIFLSLALFVAGITSVFAQAQATAPKTPDVLVEVDEEAAPAPVAKRLVVDNAGIFTESQELVLEHALLAFADTTSNAIMVVTVPTLDGYTSIEKAYEIGEKYGVGTKEHDNGIVVLVKPKTRQSRGDVAIAVGYGLEGAIPDATCKMIVEREMIPQFKTGNYFQGVVKAVNVLMPLAAGEYKYSDYGKKAQGKISGFSAIFIVIFLIALVIIITSSGGKGDKNNNGSNGGRGNSVDPFLAGMFLGSSLGGSRHSSGGFGGGGFGGFGGFGGGSFGGGGASGSW